MELVFWLYDISIPYGAIKSGNPIYDRVIKYIFQFLMVRLKGAMNFSNAIKDVFQFLMVRLKVFMV